MAITGVKLCECGCGQPAPIAKYSWALCGWVKGQPKRFISGHNTRRNPPIDESSVPPKLCECGCGGYTEIARENDASSGKVRGERMRFLRCHHGQRSLEESFRDGAIPGASGECWNWQGKIASHGYGVLFYRNKQHYAHRVSWELHNGPIPPGLRVLHICDNPSCWNPSHLFIGTDKDNAEDKVRKGRQPRGEKTPSAKLTDEIVSRIKEELARLDETYEAFAVRYGVERRAIAKIAAGECWAHIAGPSPMEMTRFHTRKRAGTRAKAKLPYRDETGQVTI